MVDISTARVNDARGRRMNAKNSKNKKTKNKKWKKNRELWLEREKVTNDGQKGVYCLFVYIFVTPEF